MELVPIFKRVIGLDVHQAQITACALIEAPDGTVTVERRQFGAFKRDRRALALWCQSLNPDEVVMESTGIYWKSPYAALEKVGIRARVVNARFIKQVPGRKTDIGDAEWLAILGRAGLLRGSFVPPIQLRELRLVARQRQKLAGQLAAEKNRLGKILADAGIRLSVVVSDLNGQSARAMITALIEGASSQEAVRFASKRLRASPEQIEQALDGEMTAAHRFVAGEVLAHIVELEGRMARFETYLIEGLKPQHNILVLLQTIPGIDLIGAAMLLVEIGADMSVFGTADRIASWVGLCPGNNESAGKRKSGHMRKGNAYVRRLMCEFAHAASKTKCGFREKFRSLVVRRGKKRSIIALAHKMLRTIFCMLRDAAPYRDSAVDYEALAVKRNAPRWIKTLRRHGFLPATA